MIRPSLRVTVLPLLLSILLGVVFAVRMSAPVAAAEGDEPDAAKPAEEPVSFYRQVRPILQRHCSGCHFPAKQGGKLMLTSYEAFKKGGETGPAFVPGKPDESLVIENISGDLPVMPLNGDPLVPRQVDLIRRWIAEGAKDDTPESLRDTVTAENPPVYANAPVITALAYSPDSQLLAVSGFHEILLHRADGSGLVARLVGRSQRINSLAFSPDGKLLAAVGGSPALFGEAQFWNVAEKKLVLSSTVGYDTLFGASFNDDGTLFAFGGADNRARVIRVPAENSQDPAADNEPAADDAEVMRLDAHSDWVLGTTFSLDEGERKGDGPAPQDDRERKAGDFAAGLYLISVSRDMSMKLTHVQTAQFIDNITSITPGALKGGLMAVQRHPHKEQVLIGGADGEPKLYKIFRTRARVIGDDFNQIRSYKKLPGRIFDLEFNKDGSLFVVGSSTAIGGAARIYKTGEFDERTINNDGGLGQVNQQIAQRSQVDALVHDLPGIQGPVFAVAFRPDGKQVAVGGFDGTVRLYDVASGNLVKEFVPVEVTPTATAAK